MGSEWSDMYMVLRVAEEMCTRLREPITVQILADDLDMSYPQILRAFSRIKKATPAAYLLDLRCRAINKDLLFGDAAKTTVKQILQQYHITSPGRFSTHYKQRFGESPLETLQRIPPARPEADPFG